MSDHLIQGAGLVVDHAFSLRRVEYFSQSIAADCELLASQINVWMQLWADRIFKLIKYDGDG